MSTLIRNGHIVTMNSHFDVIAGDLRIDKNRIVEIGKRLTVNAGDKVIDARNGFVIPGLVQAHIHLCQTLFRGLADDLELLDWLQKRIWPFEAAHNADSLRASARLGLLEVQLMGTTSILDMGTVHHHHTVFEEAERSGIRYWGGNCLMDLRKSSGPLFLNTEATIKECETLIEQWHKKTPLIEYAISPRFVISCTEKILKAAVRLRDEYNLVFHTHASENKGEIKLVRERSGLDNVKYLKKLGCLSSHTVLAHGIHLTRSEVSDLIKAQAAITHCPSSNLKLASGIAKIYEYKKRGLTVALGADGAPCNNVMDPFREMRLAALLQKPIFGPTALPAKEAFAMATIEGAKALNADSRIGSLEVDKQADVVIVQRDHPSLATIDDPYSALVYSASGRDVSFVWIDGRPIVAEGRHLIFDHQKAANDAKVQLHKLLKRVQLKS